MSTSKPEIKIHIGGRDERDQEEETLRKIKQQARERRANSKQALQNTLRASDAAYANRPQNEATDGKAAHPMKGAPRVEKYFESVLRLQRRTFAT
jgi:hypothetical protein